jgi:two-component system phosphate regulon response regulator PhoB
MSPCAMDRSTALAAISARQPRFIIVIANPPGDDALDLCRELRARDDTRRTPLMILTAIRSIDLRVAAVTAGVDEFLVKPYTAQRLRDRLRWLRRIDESQPDTSSDAPPLRHGSPLSRYVLPNNQR